MLEVHKQVISVAAGFIIPICTTVTVGLAFGVIVANGNITRLHRYLIVAFGSCSLLAIGAMFYLMWVEGTL